MKLKLAALALLPLTFLAVGCGSDEKSDEPNTSLRNADDVEESEAAAAADEVALGEFGDLSDDTRISVTAMKVGGDDFGPWLETSIRFENSSDAEVDFPDTGIVCSGSIDVGESQADSTLSIGEEVPADSYKEGVLNLLVPTDGRTQEPVSPCVGPAFVQVTALDPMTNEPAEVIRVPIAEDLVAELETERKFR